MNRSHFIIEEMTDPEQIARSQAQFGNTRRNLEWLESHWDDILPRARGRHLAVAGQQAFIADTPEEAWAMATAAHPDDNGALLQYIRSERGPRIYANRW
jgi:hypothetical protein